MGPCFWHIITKAVKAQLNAFANPLQQEAPGSVTELRTLDKWVNPIFKACCWEVVMYTLRRVLLRFFLKHWKWFQIWGKPFWSQWMMDEFVSAQLRTNSVPECSTWRKLLCEGIWETATTVIKVFYIFIHKIQPIYNSRKTKCQTNWLKKQVWNLPYKWKAQ